jgi:tetratricopeptide (TPR) repeat protein
MSFRLRSKSSIPQWRDPMHSRSIADKSVPMTAEEFRRRRLRKIVRIVVPAVAAFVVIGVVTWRATKPGETHNYYADGQKQYNNGKFYEAIAAFDHVIQERPNFMDGYRFRGMSHMQLGQSAAARQDFDKAIQLAPADVEVYRLRARLLRLSGKYQDSLADYSRIIELHPTAEAYAGRAGCYRELGKLPEALANYKLAVEMSPIVDYYVQQGLTLEQVKDFRQALQSFSKAIELRPDEPYAYRSRAFAKEQLGDKTGARADREKADFLEKPGQRPPGKS